MPRLRKQTTNRGFTREQMDTASELIIKEGRSIRSVAKDLNLCHVSLCRYCKKLVNPNMSGLPAVGYNPRTRVFSAEHEEEVLNYLLKAAELYFGLTSKEARKLAYQIAEERNINFPNKWAEDGLASKNWLIGFLKRNQALSIRKPEATSFSRETSFNRTNVNSLFDKLAELLEIHNLETHAVFNMDETGVTTVQRPCKILAKRGTKQVGSLTSAERGTLVTVTLAVSASGVVIPPQFIFPRKRFKDHFIKDGPTGSIGSGNSSRSMQEEDFIVYIQHFARHTRVSLGSKVLIILDNHESHISLPVIDFCKENGIVLLSLPPHCSHKMQPLDRSVFGPFKRLVNENSDAWMKKNPGKAMTIYDIPGIVKSALVRYASSQNITAGFASTGIFPYNRNIFAPSDFAPSEVTNRSASPTPGCSTTESTAAKGNDSLGYLDIEEILPLTKAGAKSGRTNRGRKKTESAILTSTPVREQLKNKESFLLQNALNKENRASKRKLQDEKFENANISQQGSIKKSFLSLGVKISLELVKNLLTSS